MRRKSPALNRAYAHVVARSFLEAASALVDRMVSGMGFEALNAAAVVLPDATDQPGFKLVEQSDLFEIYVNNARLELRQAQDAAQLPLDNAPSAAKSQGEEFECARMLDTLPELKHWVRTIERQPQFSFWLPTATDCFYPDFVAELNDGRLLVVEYKGDAYATNDDSREKRAVGAAWARASGGKALFQMAEKLAGGLDVLAQMRHVLA